MEFIHINKSESIQCMILELIYFCLYFTYLAICEARRKQILYYNDIF